MRDRAPGVREMLGSANPPTLQEVRQADRVRRQDQFARHRRTRYGRRARIGWSGRSYPVRSRLARRNPVDDAFTDHDHGRVGAT